MLILTSVPGPTDPGSRFARGQRVGRHLVRRLGHAVGLEHRRAECRLEIVHDLRRQRRAARPDEPELGGAGGRRRARLDARQQQLMDGRHRRVPGRAEFLGGGPERQRVELARHDDRAARRQGGQRRGDQAVHVKQRHHAQRDVARAESVAARDVAGRDRQVGVRQRHALGPAGAAARMQNQRDIVDRCRRHRVGRVLNCGPACGRGPADAHRPRRVHRDRQDRDAIAGGAPGLVEPVGRQQQHLGVGVVEIEAELLFLVARIERRRRADHRGGQERHDVRQPVGERDADAIAAGDPGRGQRARDRLHLPPQGPVTDSQVLLRDDDCHLIGGDRIEQARQRGRDGVRRGHRISLAFRRPTLLPTPPESSTCVHRGR